MCMSNTSHANNTSETRTLAVGCTVRVDETVMVVLPRIAKVVDWFGYNDRPVPVRLRQTGSDSFMVEIHPRESDDLRLWLTPAEVGLMPTDARGEWTLTCSLLVCRDQPAESAETAPWLKHLGDRKHAELRFASESERMQVAMEALNLGYRVQFTTLDAFEHASGMAYIKQLCASYYGDSGATNPTSQMEYETSVAGEIMTALEQAYQFEVPDTF